MSNKKEVNPADIKTFKHTRKGIVKGIIVDDSNPEWITVTLVNTVHGLVNTWVEGEQLTMRRSLITELKPETDNA